MKKSARTSLLVSSTLLLLISVTVSAQGQPSNAPGFAGVWNVNTDQGEKLVITLRRDGSDPSLVVGGYHLLGDVKDKPQDGALKGTVKDNVLRFTWSSDESRRAGRFTLSADGESFTGTYSRTRNPDDTSGGTWNGTRAHSFAGTWQGKWGDAILVLILQQDSSRVTGQLRLSGGDLGFIRDGDIIGDTLHFHVWRAVSASSLRPNERDDVLGSGELVMERGGKSFTGTILGAATSGTLVRR